MSQRDEFIFRSLILMVSRLADSCIIDHTGDGDEFGCNACNGYYRDGKVSRPHNENCLVGLAEKLLKELEVANA